MHPAQLIIHANTACIKYACDYLLMYKTCNYFRLNALSAAIECDFVWFGACQSLQDCLDNIRLRLPVLPSVCLG